MPGSELLSGSGGSSSSKPSIGLPREKPMQLPIPGMQFMKPPKGFSPSVVPKLPMPSLPKPSGPNLEARHGQKYKKDIQQMVQ